MIDSNVMDVLVTDPQSGLKTGLAKTARRAVKAMDASGVRYCLIGAAALAVRGLPRMTRDLDIVVLNEDGARAIQALRKSQLVASTPTGTDDALESMIVFIDPKTQVDVDLLLAEGDPEARAISDSTRASLFGVDAPVATLEHLLLLYLYSNQPKHLGDFAAIVQSKRANLGRAEALLFDMHPEMLPEFRARVHAALFPPDAPKRPPRRV